MTRCAVSVSVSPGVDHPVAWPTAPCTVDPDLFFSLKHADVHEAQRTCANCPMLARCAAFALASPEAVTDGVFASVRMPTTGALASEREEAINRLREVAATGKPSPLHDFSPRRFEGTPAELAERVIDLRDGEGLSWSEIGRQLGCNYATAQRVYTEATTSTEAVA